MLTDLDCFGFQPSYDVIKHASEDAYGTAISFLVPLIWELVVVVVVVVSST